MIFWPYHQDVFNLLKEKTQLAGIIGLFLRRRSASGQFIDALKASNHTVLAINAFPKLSASSLLYKLNPGTKVIKDRMQAVDAVLRQWQEGKAKSRVVTIAHAEAMKESCREVPGNAAHARPGAELPARRGTDGHCGSGDPAKAT